jgi:hypothetical protein
MVMPARMMSDEPWPDDGPKQPEMLGLMATSSMPLPSATTGRKQPAEDRSWRKEALCRDYPPALFFGEHVCTQECEDAKWGCPDVRREEGRFARVRLAKTICGECPVQQQCLDYALDNREAFGVWGGYTERERRKLMKGRK